MNYSELIKALRCKRDDCEGCDLAFLDKDEGWMCRYAAKDDDAADAIEALEKQIDFIENDKTNLEADIINLEIALDKVNTQLPKRGEWVKNEDRCGWHCSCCKVDNYYAYSWNSETGKNEFQDKYCPNCGAKMEVQDDKV